jgi:toxin ParE1/3/4
MPEIGGLCRFESDAAKQVRAWSVRGFENYLIFYRPLSNGIDVVRVIHGARDIAAVFDDDEA